MKYDDLPYVYRDWCESQGWEQKSALFHWQQSSEYRKYLEGQLLRLHHNELSTHSTVKYPGQVSDELMFYLRGQRIQYT